METNKDTIDQQGLTQILEIRKCIEENTRDERTTVEL